MEAEAACDMMEEALLILTILPEEIMPEGEVLEDIAMVG